MNATSLRISVSLGLGLAASALMACVSASDFSSDREATGSAKQALRYCPDGPCEPLPPKKPPTPPTPPPVWQQYIDPSTLGATVTTEPDGSFQCKGGDLAFNLADGFCYHTKPCPIYVEKSDPDAGHCVGLVYASMVQCDFSRHLVCYGWQSCSCAPN